MDTKELYGEYLHAYRIVASGGRYDRRSDELDEGVATALGVSDAAVKAPPRAGAELIKEVRRLTAPG